MLIKTTTQRHTLQKENVETSVTKSVRSHWRGRGISRPGSTSYTAVPNTVLDHSDDLNDGVMRTLTLYLSMADYTTGELQAGRAELARRRNRSVPTLKRHDAILAERGHLEVRATWDAQRGCNGKRILIVHKVPKVVEKKNTVDPTPMVTDDPLYLILTTPLSTTERQTPLPPKGGGEFSQSQTENEPQKPKPSHDVHEALRVAREQREQRRTERRAARPPRRSYREARRHVREARGGDPMVAAAVTYIMRSIGLSPALRASRQAIQNSVERWISDYGGAANVAAVKLTGLWKDYQAMSRLLDYPCGVVTWFGECRWVKGVENHEVRSLQRRLEASVGGRPPGVDLAEARSGMKSGRDSAFGSSLLRSLPR